VTFDGSCQFALVVTYSPPLTNTDAPGSAVAKGDGTCSGTLTDARGASRTLEDAIVRYQVTASGTGSCAAGASSGPGSLRFGRHALRFTFSETRAPGAAVIHLIGGAGGDGDAVAAVSSEEDPAQLLEACAGSGLRSVRVDLSLVANRISG
jgi:hypothetical protein